MHMTTTNNIPANYARKNSRCQRDLEATLIKSILRKCTNAQCAERLLKLLQNWRHIEINIRPTTNIIRAAYVKKGLSLQRIWTNTWRNARRRESQILLKYPLHLPDQMTSICHNHFYQLLEEELGMETWNFSIKRTLVRESSWETLKKVRISVSVNFNKHWSCDNISH